MDIRKVAVGHYVAGQLGQVGVEQVALEDERLCGVGERPSSLEVRRA